MKGTFTPFIVTPPGTLIRGYYLYLPEGYDPSKIYPAYIMIHGTGEIANPSNTLSVVLKNGLPYEINKGTWARNCIVVIPQFFNGPTADRIHAVIAYIKTKYKVEDKWIGTGLSLGGQHIQEWAAKYPAECAACIPMCAAASLSIGNAGIIGKNGIAFWAFHAKDDTTIPYPRTVSTVSLINAGKPAIPAKLTLFDKGGHTGGWAPESSPTWKENGLSIYEWAEQYVTAAADPVEPFTLTVEATKLTPEGVWQFKAVPSREAQIMAWDKPATSNVFAFNNTLIVFLPNSGGFTIKATMSTADGVITTGTYTEVGR